MGLETLLTTTLTSAALAQADPNQTPKDLISSRDTSSGNSSSAVLSQADAPVGELDFYVVAPRDMEGFQNLFCRTTVSASEFAENAGFAGKESKWERGEWVKAFDYIRKQFGNDRLDYCQRGTASGSGFSFGAQETGSEGVAYRIDTSWDSVFSTDSFDLCENVVRSMDTFRESLYIELVRFFGEVEMVNKDHIATLSTEDLALYDTRKRACLGTVKRGGYTRPLNNKKVPLELMCRAAIQIIEPLKETKAEEKAQQGFENWGFGNVSEVADSPKLYADQVSDVLERRLGTVPWEEWVTIDKKVCRPFVDGHGFLNKLNRNIYRIIGGAGILAVVALRLKRVFTFSGIVSELFGIRTAFRFVGNNIVKKLWDRWRGKEPALPPPPEPAKEGGIGVDLKAVRKQLIETSEFAETFPKGAEGEAARAVAAEMLKGYWDGLSPAEQQRLVAVETLVKGTEIARGEIPRSYLLTGLKRMQEDIMPKEGVSETVGEEAKAKEREREKGGFEAPDAKEAERGTTAAKKPGGVEGPGKIGK